VANEVYQALPEVISHLIDSVLEARKALMVHQDVPKLVSQRLALFVRRQVTPDPELPLSVKGLGACRALCGQGRAIVESNADVPSGRLRQCACILLQAL
jgi:hypothetical protein